MSSKSSKKVKKFSIPRPLPEVQAEYNQLCASAGQVQYQLSVLQAELTRLNERLGAVNREASARIELDRQNPPTSAPATAEVQPETATTGAQ